MYGSRKLLPNNLVENFCLIFITYSKYLSKFTFIFSALNRKSVIIQMVVFVFVSYFVNTTKSRVFRKKTHTQRCLRISSRAANWQHYMVVAVVRGLGRNNEQWWCTRAAMNIWPHCLECLTPQKGSTNPEILK